MVGTPNAGAEQNPYVKKEKQKTQPVSRLTFTQRIMGSVKKPSSEEPHKKESSGKPIQAASGDSEVIGKLADAKVSNALIIKESLHPKSKDKLMKRILIDDNDIITR